MARRGSQSRDRTRARFWFDKRFALGLVLVAASVGGVGAVVAAADRSIAVYAAAEPLAAGDRISAGDLVPTRVRFTDAATLYLTPARLPAEGLIVTRTIAAGELVAASAVGRTQGESATSIVVEIPGTLAGAVGPGAVVDVWAARRTDHSTFGPPAVLVADASVVRLVKTGGLMAEGRGQSVEIRVPRDDIAAVLESVANEDSLALVPAHVELGE